MSCQQKADPSIFGDNQLCSWSYSESFEANKLDLETSKEEIFIVVGRSNKCNKRVKTKVSITSTIKDI